MVSLWQSNYHILSSSLTRPFVLCQLTFLTIDIGGWTHLTHFKFELLLSFPRNVSLDFKIFWRNCRFCGTVKVKVKWSRYRPGVAQRVGSGIALLFHDLGTRRWWVVSVTPRPHFTPGKDKVSVLQEAVWAPGPVWTGEKSRPHRDSIPDRPTRSYL